MTSHTYTYKLTTWRSITVSTVHDSLFIFFSLGQPWTLSHPIHVYTFFFSPYFIWQLFTLIRWQRGTYRRGVPWYFFGLRLDPLQGLNKKTFYNCEVMFSRTPLNITLSQGLLIFIYLRRCVTSFWTLNSHS